MAERKVKRPLKEVAGGVTELTYEDVLDSLRNPVVSKAVRELVSIVSAKGWTVTASSDAVSQFVHQALRPVWDRLIFLALEALHWGYAAMEVIWDVRDISVAGSDFPSAIVPTDFKPLDPSRVTFLADEETGEIVGVRYRKRGASRLSTERVDILDEKVFWYSHCETTVQSPYGLSVYVWTKPFEEMMRDTLELLAVWIENVSMPPLVGFAPDVMMQLDDGSEVQALQYMSAKLDEFRRTGQVVLPSSYDAQGQPLWRIEAPMRFGEGGSQIVSTFDALRTILRAAVLGAEGGGMGAGPFGGMGGGLGQGPTQLLAAYIFSELLTAINRRLVKWLVYLNWGPEEWATLKSIERGTDVDLVRDILRTILQFSDPMRRRIASIIDWFGLMGMFGIPLSPEGTQKGEELLASPEASLSQMLQGIQALQGLGAVPMVPMLPPTGPQTASEGGGTIPTTPQEAEAEKRASEAGQGGNQPAG